MPTLFDKLEKKLSGASNDVQLFAPQQAGIAGALRAKSGKGPGGGGVPAASNLGEQSAIGSAQSTLQQGAANAAIAGAKLGVAADTQAQKIAGAEAALANQASQANKALATQAQASGEQIQAQQDQAMAGLRADESRKVELLNHQASSQLKQLAADRGLTVDNLFRDFDFSERELAFRKDAARLEQLGFMMAMQDRAYLDELNRIGIERDLTDRIAYAEEMQNTIFGQNMSMVIDDLGFRRKLGDNQREWDRVLASMDLESAMAIAAAQARDANTTAMWSGGGAAVKAGIDYAVKKPAKSPTPTQDYKNYQGTGGELTQEEYEDKYGTETPTGGYQTDTAGTGSMGEMS